MSTSTTSAAIPYLAYSYGYDVEGTNKRNTFYAQDQWTVGRLTANLGLRIDSHSGEGANGIEYYSTNAVGPRLGVAFDLTGQATSVLRAFYGQLTAAPFSTTGVGPFRARPITSPTTCRPKAACRRPIGSRRRTSTASPPTSTTSATDEFNVSFEQQLFRTDRSCTATYIRREIKNFDQIGAD